VKKLDQFTYAYIEAMMWSSNDESDEYGGEPLDKNYDISDIATESLDKIIKDCEQFQEENADDLEQVPDMRFATDSYGNNSCTGYESAGHDFWLTRNGHGSGFWDRNYDQAVKNRLDAACKAFGECYVYIGDDGLIYIS
jgi:hypothetical protein